MLRLRLLSCLVICTAIFGTVAPALPAHAAPSATVKSPLRQKEISDHIADIRKEDPDIEEDFSSGKSLFDTSYDSDTSIYMKSGELRIGVDAENTLSWTPLSKDVADYYVEVDAIHHEGSLDNEFGILSRLDDDGNYYFFTTSSDGYYSIQKRSGGKWETVVDWTETGTINQDEGATNTLGLLAEGDSYAFLINDTIVDSTVDDTISGTRIALGAAAFSDPPIDMGFDNFRLWYVGEPVPTVEPVVPVDGRNAPPTSSVTPAPTEEATQEATQEATDKATEVPTEESTPQPTEEATEQATEEPTVEPTQEGHGTSSDPTIAAIQAQTPTFSDDFESGDMGDWAPFESDSVEYDASKGTLDFTFSAPNTLSWVELPDSPTNYYVEADATVASKVDAAEYGIIFNYVDSQNFYLFAVNDGSNYSVWHLNNNAWETVADWQESDILKSGEGNTNRLGLLVQGKHVTLQANDEVLSDFDLDEDASGGVALAAGTFADANLIMKYDNVALWDLDATGPQPTEEATAEPTEKATEEATSEPTEEATDEATPEPTEEATVEPTKEATEEPTVEPTEEADFSAVTAHIADITAEKPDIVDDFRTDNGLWDVLSDDYGSSYYKNRALNIEAKADGRIIWSSTYESKDDRDAGNALQFDDFYIEFDTTFVTYTGENTAGLVFRMTDTDNFYKFMVDETGYYQLNKRVNGEYQDVIPWALTDAADTTDGAINKIGILAEGSTLAFSVNGTVIAQVEDTDFSSGSLALAIQTYTATEGHSTFDNFKLWELK